MAYASSKNAKIWFTNHLERLYASQGVHVISLHPGAVETGLQRFHSPESLEVMKAAIPESELPGLKNTYKSIEQGAATTVLAAISKAFEGKGGIYLDECQVARLHDLRKTAAGYAAHAFDEDNERKLWEMSLLMTAPRED